VNIGTIVTLIMARRLDAAITKVLSKHNPKVQFRAFDTIDNAPEERERGITIAVRTWSMRHRTVIMRTWIAGHATTSRT